jgi:hypothetical protein
MTTESFMVRCGWIVEQSLPKAKRSVPGIFRENSGGRRQRFEAIASIRTGICRFTGHSPGGYWFDYALTERDTTTLNDPQSGTRNR